MNLHNDIHVHLVFDHYKQIPYSHFHLQFYEHVASFRPMLEDSKVHKSKALQKTKAENLEISKNDKQLVELRKELHEAAER